MEKKTLGIVVIWSLLHSVSSPI